MTLNNETPDNGANTFGTFTMSDATKMLEERYSDSEYVTANQSADVEADSEESPPSDDAITVDAEHPHADSDIEEDTDNDEASAEADDAEGSEDSSASNAYADDVEIALGSGEKVALGELKTGYLRHQDYTRKTQETAAERKTYEAARTQTIQALSDFRRDALVALSLEYVPSPEELSALAETDPGEYVRLKAKIDQRNNVFQHTMATIARLEGEAARMAQENLVQAHDEARQELVRMHPEFLTEKGLGDRLGHYLVEQGVPAEEVQANTNPLLFSIALKAMKWDNQQTANASVKQKIEAKPALVKPGSRTVAPDEATTAARKALRDLKRTGSITAGEEWLRARYKGL